VYIFKWLQFLSEQRNVKYEPAPYPPCDDDDAHNLEIYWHYLDPTIKQTVKQYGVCEHKSPQDYLEENAGKLVQPNEHDFRNVDYSHLLPRDVAVKPAHLTGTDEALDRFGRLSLETLERHGLTNYKHYLRPRVQ